MKFRKNPIVIDAEQYREGQPLPRGVCMSPTCQGGKPHVHTMHNNQHVLLKDGDWVIPEPDGVHFYPCDAEVFAKTYTHDTPENSASEDQRDSRGDAVSATAEWTVEKHEDQGPPTFRLRHGDKTFFTGDQEMTRLADYLNAAIAKLREERGAILHELAGTPDKNLVELARLRMEERERAIQTATALRADDIKGLDGVAQ